MKLILLTDFNGNGKEYVVLDEIARIEPYEEDVSEQRENIELDQSYWFWPRTRLVKTNYKIGVKKGSTIILKTGLKTMVQESPEEVVEAIRKAITFKA